MPRYCHRCEIKLPDAVNIDGLRGLNYCPFCGIEVEEHVD